MPALLFIMAVNINLIKIDSSIAYQERRFPSACEVHHQQIVRYKERILIERIFQNERAWLE